MQPNFFALCKVCNREVDNFSQNVKFLIVQDLVVQERETIKIACGCVIDFPKWQIDPETGLCRIYNFAGTLYLEFIDKETMYAEEDE
jgi:hypothetical protein